MSKKPDKICDSKKILREGYERKAYKRKNGTFVHAAYIKPTCVKDMGRPGKGPKTLPKPDKLIHLTNYGYSVHAPDKKREAALLAASKDYGILPILRRINLIRNYQAVPENKLIFSKDVDYMKKLYANAKKNSNKKFNQ